MAFTGPGEDADRGCESLSVTRSPAPPSWDPAACSRARSLAQNSKLEDASSPVMRPERGEEETRSGASLGHVLSS